MIENQLDQMDYCQYGGHGHAPVDPYPYIFLNLILSYIAAIQAPVIMMSQNRQEAFSNDYKINLKAELEIRHLNEKLDHLLMHQWNRLAKYKKYNWIGYPK